MKIVPSNSMAAVALLSCSTSTVQAKGFQSGRNAWSLGRNVNVIAGLVKKRRRPPVRVSNSNSDSLGPLFLQDEVCDCFENNSHSPIVATSTNTVFAQSTSIVERDSPKKSLSQSVQYMIRGCCFSCPGASYDIYHTNRNPSNDHRGEAVLISLRTLKQRAEKVIPKIRAPAKAPQRLPEKGTGSGDTSITEQEERPLTEPSPAILAGIIQPLIPTNIWKSLTGREFFFPSTLTGLIQTGIKTVLPQSDEFIDWSPADTKTKKLFELNDNQAIRNALEDDDVLVWVGKFKDEGHGSHLPIVKTTSILPLSPKDMASLLMDSSKVQSYNKMSLGRNDEVIFQQGINTEADGPESGALAIDGEAKIVRNLTKPPLSKKLMEFVTVMYARRLKPEDNVGVGIMGGDYEDGYAVISRAVSGGKWGGISEEGEESERTRSEILLGMNLIRTVPGEANKSEVTAVTHCNSPSVPKMLAKTVGVKGAVDFVRDIRAEFS